MKRSVFTSVSKATETAAATAAVVLDPANWVDHHADYLYSYAMGRLDDDELCRDLVQETFLAALEKVAEFRGESTERTWLTAILKYKVIAVYRKRSALVSGWHTEPMYFDPVNGHWTEECAPQAMGIESGESRDPIMQKELAGILQRCLQKLPQLWLCIFSMKYMDDADSEVICQELRVSSSNYWVILHRAKVNLRACIQKEYV